MLVEVELRTYVGMGSPRFRGKLHRGIQNPTFRSHRRVVHMKSKVLLFITLAAIVSTLPLAAQTSVGTIVGNITDESAALVPGVTITITNAGTNTARTATSNDTGGYTVPSLPPAIYSIEAELAGFSKAVVTAVQLEVNQTLRVDMTLMVGEVTETVEVSATAP